jgi:hypothetical protein
LLFIATYGVSAYLPEWLVDRSQSKSFRELLWSLIDDNCDFGSDLGVCKREGQLLLGFRDQRAMLKKVITLAANVIETGKEISSQARNRVRHII